MNFDRVAPVYGWLERLFALGQMQRCRVAMLDDIASPRRVLLAGEGPGKFLKECLRRFPSAEFVVVDASAAMLERAKHGIDCDRVSWVHAELPDWNGTGNEFDLIVTHFFLDCFTAEKLARVIEVLGKRAAPAADWLVADFEIAPRGWRRCWSKVVVGMLYGFFRRTTGLEADALVPPESELRRAGFELKKRVAVVAGLMKSEWWRRAAP